MTTTCQICGRAILAKRGLIAHHGYQRPGHGWQTSSCFGARWKPYEVACDAIDHAIAQCNQFVDRATVRIAELVGDPPAEIVESRKVGWEVRNTTLVRPEGFNPTKPGPGSYRRGTGDHYASEFHNRVNRLRDQIAAAHRDIEFMAERKLAWKPSTALVEG